MEEIMSTSAKPEVPRVDQFFMVAEARFDRWRTLLQAARTWERSSNQQPPNRAEQRAAVAKLFPGVASVGGLLCLSGTLPTEIA